MAKAITVRAERETRTVTGWDWVLTLTVVIGVLLAVAIALRLYQGRFAWTAGLDATSPDFATYWMGLFWVEMVSLSALALVWWGWAGWKRCTACEAQRLAMGRVAPDHELYHIAMLWVTTTVATFAAAMTVAIAGEQDAAWHQVAIRDTAFTPSHIVLFYFWFPLLVISSVATFLYGRTRVPQIYRDRGYALSSLLVMSGTFLLTANVAFNEFGHSFWIAEEIFSAPMHWPFVIFFYVTAPTFSVWFQTLPRIYQLIDEVRAKSGQAA
jgi:methane/ammonia monooxygenase subunit C